MVVDMKNENGQAVIEFLLFLPFTLVMYAVLMNLGNAINGSINQQKVTRGYLFARTLNNSTVPKPEPAVQGNWNKFGMFFIGYNESRTGSTPIAACYRMKSPLPSNEDSCDKYTSTSTQWIRVQTAYGLCGATYVKNGQNMFSWATSAGAGLASVQDACEIH